MNVKKQGWVFAQTPIWAACDPRISDGAHRLLAYLAWRQGNDDSCWPSVRRIGEDLGTSERTVQRRLRELEEAGYLTTSQRFGRSSEYSLVADPDGASEKYTPTPDRVVGGPPTGVSPTPDRNDGGPRTGVSPTPDRIVRGPPTGVSSPPVSSVTHDDKKGQEKKNKRREDKRKMDDARLPSWSSVLKNLRLQMTAATFETWLAEATARREGDTLFIQLADEQAVDWVSHRLDRTVRRTAGRLFEDGDLCVAYEVR